MLNTSKYFISSVKQAVKLPPTTSAACGRRKKLLAVGYWLLAEKQLITLNANS
jgi:hypothetical protein